MTHVAQKLREVAETIKLTRQEKEAGRDFLRTVIAVSPFHTHSFATQLLPRMAPFFAVAVLGIGALTYTAEQSTPGSYLYDMKTGINERVRDFLPGSTEQNLEWEVTKQERRNAEAEVMAAELGF